MILLKDVLERVSTKTALEHYGVLFNARNFVNCPFHNEKTPSLHYYPKTDTYYCFSCHRGGNLINFVADYCNYSLPRQLPEILKKIDLDFNLGLSKELPPDLKKEYIEDQKINKQMQMIEKKLEREASEQYDLWIGVYRHLYKMHLKEAQHDPALINLMENMEHDLDIYGEDAVRVWSSLSFTGRQSQWVQFALLQRKHERERDTIGYEKQEEKTVEQKIRRHKGR